MTKEDIEKLIKERKKRKNQLERKATYLQGEAKKDKAEEELPEDVKEFKKEKRRLKEKMIDRDSIIEQMKRRKKDKRLNLK